MTVSKQLQKAFADSVSASTRTLPDERLLQRFAYYAIFCSALQAFSHFFLSRVPPNRLCAVLFKAAGRSQPP